MKKAIVVLNAPPYNRWSDNSRQSMQAAATRWGADLVEIPFALHTGNLWDKFLIPKMVMEYDLVLQADYDLCIRCDCPSPFEFGHLSMVDDHQASWWQERVGEPAGLTQKKANALSLLGLQSWPDKVRIFNTGFVVYDPVQMWALTRHCFKLGRQVDWAFEDDQTLFSLYLYTSGQRVKVLPREFNVINPIARQIPLHGPMSHWVVHLAGQQKHYCEHMKWWLSPETVVQAVEPRDPLQESEKEWIFDGPSMG